MGALIGHHGLLLAGGGGPSDPNYANVSLLLHMEGANGGTTFTDNSSSPKTPTLGGSGTITTSTTQAKYGSTSGWFNAPASLTYASDAAFGFGAGDYTMECFAYVSPGLTSNELYTLLDTRTAGNTGVQLLMGGGVSGVPANTIACSSNSAVMASGGTVSANAWYHIALCRSGTTLRGFVDGVQAFSVTDSRTYASASTLKIGSDYAGTVGQEMKGFVDEVRITKGVARYTAGFTPPSAPFPDH